ncbi:MAG: hypothetical protein GY839_10405 [candidate division Zixibacteria bacterium]|nr:hypothetical protein [candidate division Zixibacteria bacterium]
MADRVSDKTTLQIGSNVINTVESKIFFEDYFDNSDSLNIAGLISKDYTCVISGINWYTGGNIQDYADSLHEIQRFRESEREYSENTYEVAGDTIYYYQQKSNFITAIILNPKRNIYLETMYLTDSEEKVKNLVNEMIYYNQKNVTWKELQ